MSRFNKKNRTIKFRNKKQKRKHAKTFKRNFEFK